MILYHATLKANLDSILKTGLNPEYSKGNQEQVIYLHTASRRHWAILHTATRHSASLYDILIIEVNVPRGKRRRRRRGLWTTDQPITSIGARTEAAEYSTSYPNGERTSNTKGDTTR